jgi:two-component system chemotaxis response regulator CheY
MMHCLIVDDSKTIRKITNGILTEMGFECSEAEDGKAACERCAISMPDLVILDWNMPVMNGLEFLLALRRMQGGERPKVIFCTTENELDYIQKAMEAGADEYIMKPFDKGIIESKLMQIGVLEEHAI